MLLDVTGAQNVGEQVLDGMIESFRKLPSVPAGFLDRFRTNAHPEELTALIVPIYVKHFDRETLIAAIRFYQSKPGRVLVAKLPAATKDGMEAGKTWGRALAQKTLEEMGAAAPKAP